MQSQTKKNEHSDEADGGHHLTSNEEEAYEAAFHKYDADDSGKIDDEEFSCLLEETTGIKPTAEEIAELKVLAQYVKGECAWAIDQFCAQEEWNKSTAHAEIDLDDFLQMMSAVSHHRSSLVALVADTAKPSVLR